MYTPRRRAKHAKKSGPFRRIRLLIAFCFVVAAGLAFGYIFAAYQSLPAVNNNMRPAVSSQVFDIHGRLITTLHSDQTDCQSTSIKYRQIYKTPLLLPKTIDFMTISASTLSASSAQSLRTSPTAALLKGAVPLHSSLLKTRFFHRNKH